MALSKRQKEMLEWRREQTLRLVSTGATQSQIAQTLQVSRATVNLDIGYWKKQARDNIENYLQQRLPYEIERASTLIDQIKLKAWNMAQESKEDKRIQLMALDLCKDCALISVDLASHDHVVSEALEMVQEQKERLHDIKESGATDHQNSEAIF